MSLTVRPQILLGQSTCCMIYEFNILPGQMALEMLVQNYFTMQDALISTLIKSCHKLLEGLCNKHEYGRIHYIQHKAGAFSHFYVQSRNHVVTQVV